MYSSNITSTACTLFKQHHAKSITKLAAHLVNSTWQMLFALTRCTNIFTYFIAYATLQLMKYVTIAYHSKTGSCMFMRSQQRPKLLKLHTGHKASRTTAHQGLDHVHRHFNTKDHVDIHVTGQWFRYDCTCTNLSIT